MRQQWAGAVLVVLLAGCGGGGDDGLPLDRAGADVPATLASPTDAAMAAAALTGFINLTGGLTLQGGSSGKALAKGTATVPCDTGSQTFTTDDSTPFGGDGRTQFDDCVHIVTQNNSEVLRTISDGVRTTKCRDTAANSQCQDESATTGEDSVPLRFEIVTPGSDQRVLALGVGRETSTGDRFANGAEQYDNLVNFRSATLVLDNMLMFQTAASGSRSARLGGVYGLSDRARTSANCISGKLTVSTPVALSIDGNENFVGGQLHFVSDNGGIADVTFQSNQTVSASVNGGTPQTFSAAQFRQFCSIQ